MCIRDRVYTDKYPETCIMIYDILQGNLATGFRSGGTSDYDFMNLFWNNF